MPVQWRGWLPPVYFTPEVQGLCCSASWKYRHEEGTWGEDVVRVELFICGTETGSGRTVENADASW